MPGVPGASRTRLILAAFTSYGLYRAFGAIPTILLAVDLGNGVVPAGAYRGEAIPPLLKQCRREKHIGVPVPKRLRGHQQKRV